ncbi:MAG: SCP2 sterol-binding domain-containing protein [Anaerolineaceae bacterium]|nr:SCP2 sterol-binding domain-containing protein [Anaerolineaceae bacterium]
MDLRKLNLRQTIEGMPLTFNSEAAAGLDAVIQFDVSGAEPGVYHLSITEGECHFHVGSAESPTLTIATPSDIWCKISHGEISGQDALMQGLYTAAGDLSLMLKMDALFKSADQVSYEAPSSQRPAGPIPLPGMSWMTVAYIPWILHWVTFDIPGISHWISVGIPLLLSIMIVGYRLVFDRPTWMEWGGLGFFSLTGGLALTGSSGYAHWGSIVSSLVMAGLWLSSLQFSKTPLSGDYSKWGFIKALWQNNMFTYPNAVISLMWGWQFITASLLGIAAILLPEQMIFLTVARYLLLVPAFIFTSTYQKRVPIGNPKMTNSQLRFWAGMGLSAISGLLLTAAMPGFDVPYLGWIALVPLLMVITTSPPKQYYILALPFGLLFSIGVHNWYPQIFPPVLGYFLIFAVGAFYAGILQLGIWLQSRLRGALKLLALPVAWSAVEFVKFVAPVVEDWWFVLLAKSMWRFPPALQILSRTGFPGLSFLVMLVNVAIALILLKTWRSASLKVSKRVSLGVLVVVAAVLLLSAFITPSAPSNTFTIAALTDMVVQDQNILSTSEFDAEDFDTSANSPETSQAIFDVDAALTRQISSQEPDFIVWPENEFADVDDAHFMDQLNLLAVEVGSYIVADTIWNTPIGMHDTALMVGPDGAEVGRQAKINTTDGEENAGFVPGPTEYPVFDTPYGKVGLGVCWDRHPIYITRALARSGAKIVLMPVDDDFNGSFTFPPFHASDGVFRSVENRVAMGLGTINGISLVIDPYGRITAEGEINERSVIIGETFTASGQTLYTRFGDWFGWLMVAALIGLIGLAHSRRADSNDI